MGMSRFTAIAAGAVFAISLSTSAGAVASESECVQLGGSSAKTDTQELCYIPVYKEDTTGDNAQSREETQKGLQGYFDASECKGTLIKSSSASDYCKVVISGSAPKAASVVLSDSEKSAIVTASDTVSE